MNEPSGEDKAPPAVSVVIVAYNSGATLGRCVAALAAQTFDDFELIIVDNASPQQEAGPAAAGFSGARVIEAGGNLGFAAGVNLGAREALGRWLVLLNPDAYPDPDWLAQLVAASRRHPLSRRLPDARSRRYAGGRGLLPLRGGDDGRPDPVPPPGRAG